MKTIILILGLLVSFIGSTFAQNNRPRKENGFVKIADRILTAYERTTDSINRRNDINNLYPKVISKKTDLDAAHKQKAEIEKFHVGRTAEQKIQQEKEWDNYIMNLEVQLHELNTELQQKVQIYKEVYGDI